MIVLIVEERGLLDCMPGKQSVHRVVRFGAMVGEQAGWCRCELLSMHRHADERRHAQLPLSKEGGFYVFDSTVYRYRYRSWSESYSACRRIDAGGQVGYHVLCQWHGDCSAPHATKEKSRCASFVSRSNF